MINMLDFKGSPSLTEGIFIKKCSSKKKKKGSKSKPLHHLQYKTLLESTQKHIKEIEKGAYKDTFDELVNYVLECHSAFKLYSLKEIPSAILMMGLNMSDHSNIFQFFEEELHENGIFATVQLHSRDCQTILGLMKKMVSGIIGQYQKITKGNVHLKRNENTLANLLSFYNNLPGPKKNVTRKSPRSKKLTPHLKGKPIVILLQDVESFNSQVLNDFILNCNIYISKLPIVLIFGMSTAMVTLHNILSQRALAALDVETFSSLTAIEYLNKIIQEVFLSPTNPFKLGAKPFKLIMDTVLYHDFSVTNLIQMLKMCLFEHFCGNNNTSLCCSPSQIREHLASFSNKQLEGLKNIPSLIRYLDKNADLKAKLKNKKDFRILVENMLMQNHAYYQWMIVLLNCLHILTEDLPNYPLGKHLREIYPLALEDKLASRPSYLEAMKLLKIQSKGELCEKIKLCIQQFELVNNPDNEIIEIKCQLKVHLDKLQHLTEADYEKKRAESPQKGDNSTYGLENLSITSRSQLKERLRMSLKMKKSKFEKCRENIVDYFSSIFEKMDPPSHLPLYEILYLEDNQIMKQNRMAVPKMAMHKNLVNPWHILKCSCCNIKNTEEFSSSMPDICILYKLHLESGKLINMYDWLQAFKSTKENAKNKKKYDDKEMNIRFMQALSELQILGYIKPTSRKTDHVMRLTFLSC